ncbi:MAG: DegT/DnrJ/EryC1/StrS aminotransferase family protein [Pseudomonadota bacterium]
MNFLPFARPTIDLDMIAGVTDTLASGWLASGPQVIAFEKALSEYMGGRPVRTLTSATAAMEVALQVAGISKDDEVITSAQSFFATPNMILKVGAKPIFVDVDLITRNQDLRATEAAITPRTKAIMPTHFAGLPMDMDALYALAKKHNLRVIEDAALAIGSLWQGKPIGSFGDLVSFSFHPNKNMTTIEGGALSVATEDDAKLVEKLRFHGIIRLPDGTRDVDCPGGKFNMSDVSARLGLSQLARLDDFNFKRRELVTHYFKCFQTDPACVLPARGDDGHSWNMFAVLLPLDRVTISRKQFMDEMQARGIGTGVSYEALHLATLYRQLGYQEGDFPNAERIGRETVTLPLFPTMTLTDVERVCENVAQVLATYRK